MDKTKITDGHTNNKWVEGSTFFLEKKSNGLNHQIDYKATQEFDFVPRLLKDGDIQEWEYIEGTMLQKPSSDDLKALGVMIRTLHLSEASFPSNNLRKRVHDYHRIISDKGMKVREIDDNWKKMWTLIKRMNFQNPSHNDLWWQNIIKDKNGKLFLVDWEYATMSDKHFDLAYYIESQKLTPEEEKTFLDAYNSLSVYQSYIPEWMNQYKLFVNWLTLLWAYAQDKEPFPLDAIKARVRELSK